MIKFLVASYVKDTGCTALARQIAKYCAAGGNSVVLVTESGLYDKLKETDSEYSTISFRDRIPEDTDIAVLDYGDSSDKIIKEDLADRIYLIVDADRLSPEALEKKLFTRMSRIDTNSTAPYECSIVLYNTNDMKQYKGLRQKIIKTAGIETGECQYEIRMDLDLFSHQHGFDVPEPSAAFRYEPLSEKKQKPSSEPEKKEKVPGISGIPFFSRKDDDRNKNKPDEGNSAERKYEQTGSEEPESDEMPEDYTKGHSGIEYEDDGSFASKLAGFKDAAIESSAGIFGAVVSGLKNRSSDKNHEKKESDSPGKRLHTDDSRNAGADSYDAVSLKQRQTDWARKINGIDARTKAANHVFSIVNWTLIIAVIVMCITTFLAFRNSMHRMVTNKELVKTEFPVRVETDGISVTNYSGIAKNRKVAVVIGDDEFVKKDSRIFQKLRKKEAVETRKYEIDVTYTDNPLLQSVFGTLTFVHHSAFGEGEFSKEEVAEIMAYSRKWFSKKRYDFFGFNDKNTINVNDPPDSLLRDTGTGDD